MGIDMGAVFEPATGQQQRQIDVVMAITIAHARSKQNDRIVQQGRAIGLTVRLQPIKECAVLTEDEAFQNQQFPEDGFIFAVVSSVRAK